MFSYKFFVVIFRTPAPRPSTYPDGIVSAPMHDSVQLAAIFGFASLLNRNGINVTADRQSRKMVGITDLEIDIPTQVTGTGVQYQPGLGKFFRSRSGELKISWALFQFSS